MSTRNGAGINVPAASAFCSDKKNKVVRNVMQRKSRKNPWVDIPGEISFGLIIEHLLFELGLDLNELWSEKRLVWVFEVRALTNRIGHQEDRTAPRVSRCGKRVNEKFEPQRLAHTTYESGRPPARFRAIMRT